MKKELHDRNKKAFKLGNICKYRKTIGGDFIFVVIKRKEEFGLHRQGFHEPMCAGCWNYTNLEEESFEDVEKNWDEASDEVKKEYRDFADYLDRYCIEIVGNIEKDRDKFKLDPKYYKNEVEKCLKIDC